MEYQGEPSRDRGFYNMIRHGTVRYGTVRRVMEWESMMTMKRRKKEKEKEKEWDLLNPESGVWSQESATG